MDSDYQGSSLLQETFVSSCFISGRIFLDFVAEFLFNGYDLPPQGSSPLEPGLAACQHY